MSNSFPTKPQPSATSMSLQSPPQPKAPSPQASFRLAKSETQKIIEAWAESLHPKNAPSPATEGPLSWVRRTKVPELLKFLNAIGAK